MNWLRKIICDRFHDWRRVTKIGPGLYACPCGVVRTHPAYTEVRR